MLTLVFPAGKIVGVYFFSSCLSVFSNFLIKIMEFSLNIRNRKIYKIQAR